MQRTVLFALVTSQLVTWIALGYLLLDRAAARDHLDTTRISAERIDIVGVNGAPVLALANQRHIPGPTFGGKEYPAAFGDGRNLLSGMIFFNEEGDEVGGLVFNGIPKEDGYWAGGHLSFDQWRQNQVVAIQYLDNGQTRRAGLRVWDRPSDLFFGDFLDLGLRRMESEDEAERERLRAEMATMREKIGVERLFVGSRDQVAQVEMRDEAGQPRLRLLVDEAGPRLEFLDAAGAPVLTLPEPAG